MRPTPLLTLALLGCQQAADSPGREQETPTSELAEAPASEPRVLAPSPTNDMITEAENLVGEYRLAGAAGRDINLPYGITARISDVAILVEADCVKLSWSYFFEGTRLVTEQVFPRESCGRALVREEEAIVAAFNGATSVGRTPANGVEFGGENGSVLLFSQ